MKLLNAFTPAMLANLPGTVTFEPIEPAVAIGIAAQGLESCVGHPGAAELYEAKLGVPVPMNRVNTRLALGEVALLGQYMGPRLPEGKALTREEFEAAPMKWMLVKVGA